MFSNNAHAPPAQAHRSRSQHSSPDRLPQGECRFIRPEPERDGSRQRCACVSFTLNADIPGSQCGCGHQAWHHLRHGSRSGDFVPLEEHGKLLERSLRVEDALKRLQDQLTTERREYERANKEYIHMLRGNYSNMAFLRYYIDEKLETLRLHCEDKTEGVLDKAHGANEEIENMKAHIADLDESIIRIEERVDGGRWKSRSLTPMPGTPGEMVPVTTTEPVPEIPATLPFRTDDKHREAWDIRIILVPSRQQTHAFELGSLAFRRCQSRGMQQDMHIQDQSAAQFVQCIEAAFATILRGRPWMPLMCLRSSDSWISQIPPVERQPERWDYVFLESQCMGHDKIQGDVIYIALAEVDLSWPDMRSLPRVFGSDETLWHRDSALDGLPQEPVTPSRMDFKRSPPSRPIDSDSVYEYSPPPYSTGSIHADRLPSALGVLAGAAGAATYLAEERANSIAAANDPMMTIEEDEGHRDKRTRRGLLRPEPQPQPTPMAPLTPTSSAAQQSSYYYSGRSKRKISAAKTKEPLDWRVSEMKIGNPAKNFFHRHDKGKAAENAPAQHPDQMS